MTDTVFVFQAKIETVPEPTYKNVEATLPAMKKFMEKVPPFVDCDYVKIPVEEEQVDITLDYEGNPVRQKYRGHYQFWGQMVWQSRCNAFLNNSNVKKTYVIENGEVFIEMKYPEVKYRRAFTPAYSHKVVCLYPTFDLTKKPGLYQLAFAIVLEETGDPIKAQKLYLKFFSELLDKPTIQLTFEEIHKWLKQHEEEK